MSGLPQWAIAARSKWFYRGQERPPFAIEPGPHQRSVWDFPRPPAIESVPDEVRVCVGEREIARTRRCLRVLETASPPTYYLPPEDVDTTSLVPAPGHSQCEWKGEAAYWQLAHAEGSTHDVAWSYPEPFPEFECLSNHLSFYPAYLACFVGRVRVRPQPGGFYGGWVTPELVGPFKGEPGVSSRS
jgi:uncharacterized protein (DUF427 family)